MKNESFSTMNNKKQPGMTEKIRLWSTADPVRKQLKGANRLPYPRQNKGDSDFLRMNAGKQLFANRYPGENTA